MVRKTSLTLAIATGVLLTAGIIVATLTLDQQPAAAAAHKPFTGAPDDVITIETLCHTEGQSRICSYR